MSARLFEVVGSYLLILINVSWKYVHQSVANILQNGTNTENTVRILKIHQRIPGEQHFLLPSSFILILLTPSFFRNGYLYTQNK